MNALADPLVWRDMAPQGVERWGEVMAKFMILGTQLGNPARQPSGRPSCQLIYVGGSTTPSSQGVFEDSIVPASHGCLARMSKMLEVGERFRLGHGAPRTFLE